jgi:hypothetical protein
MKGDLIQTNARLRRLLIPGFRRWAGLGLGFLAFLSLIPTAQAQADRPSGTVVGWGWGGYLPYVEPGTRFTVIAAGAYFTVALRSDGAVVMWGTYGNGLGPAPVAAQSGVTAIAAGAAHTVCLKSDGSIVAWGTREVTENWDESKVPVGFPPALAVAAGGGSLAIVRDPQPSLTLLRNADQTLNLSWTGAGTLEQSASLSTPNWQPAPSQANPQSFKATEPARFFRLKAE